MQSDLDTYERLGDLDAPFAPDVKHERRQRDRQRLRDSVHCDTAPLTYEQHRDGLPCPGCHRPYVDLEPFENKGTLHFSDAERARYDAEEAHFTAAHGTCGSIRHGVSGSLTKHCGKCCPRPPLSLVQRDRLVTLMSIPTPAHELMIWRLRLYCGHTVERQAHSSHKTVQAAFTGSVKCPQCATDPATSVDARAIGLAGQPHRPTSAPAVRKPTRAALERRVKELEAEVDRLRAASAGDDGTEVGDGEWRPEWPRLAALASGPLAAVLQQNP